MPSSAAAVTTEGFLGTPRALWDSGRSLVSPRWGNCGPERRSDWPKDHAAHKWQEQAPGVSWFSIQAPYPRSNVWSFLSLYDTVSLSSCSCSLAPHRISLRLHLSFRPVELPYEFLHGGIHRDPKLITQPEPEHPCSSSSTVPHPVVPTPTLHQQSHQPLPLLQP